MAKKCRLCRFLVACAAPWHCVACSAGLRRPAPQTAPGDPLDPRTYAPDSRLFLVVHARGVQNYTCQANGTLAVHRDPEGILYKTTGVPKPIGTHFLHFATRRPVWQLKDGSSVEAARTVTGCFSRESRQPPGPMATV